MNQSALVSVIVPTYGRPEFLHESVASILGQTHQNLEVLVVDDHSPEPVEIDVGDGRLTLIRHHRNMGPGAARNTGLAHARGRFVVFLDDDDLLSEDRIERGIREIGDARFHCVRSNANDRRYEGDMRETLHHANPPLIQQVMLRREDACQFDPALRVSEDIDWWLRMRDRAVFAWSDEPGFWYRQHDTDRPGVSPEIRFRCRQVVALRHAANLDRRARAHQYQRVSASAMLARRRIQTLRYSAGSLVNSPNAAALKLLLRSLIPTPGWAG